MNVMNVELQLTFSMPSSISVGSSPTENMHLTIAEMTNIRTVERRGITMTAARDVNIVVHTIPDIRPPSSVNHTHTHIIFTSPTVSRKYSNS